MRAALSALAFLALAAAPAAGAPTLSLPVDCELGKTCYVQQYMDHDPGAGHSDFMCGPRSYDAHKGTDFAVPTAAAARENAVRVLAAAAGTVMGVRDEMADAWDGEIDTAAIKGRDCGNGMVIDHGAGWQTQYCHLRQGSVRVKRGERVASGAHLGDIGMSGRTEFAHMHLSVRKDGEPVDPFAPDGPECGDAPLKTMWDTAPLFQEAGLLDLGFATQAPEFTDVKMGLADQNLSRTSPAIITFSYFFGGLAGDSVDMTLTGPGNFEVSQNYELPKNLAIFFRAIGKKRRSAPWPGGDYVAETTLTRNGKIIAEQRGSFTIPR